jgi:hypothetical protein
MQDLKENFFLEHHMLNVSVHVFTCIYIAQIFERYEKIYKENIKKIYLHNLTTLRIYINIYH